MAKIRISELPELTSGSINTILVGNDNNVTYKIPLTVLTASVVQLLSQSTDARLDLLEQFESEFLPFSSSVHNLIIAATNEQSLGHLTTTSSFNTFTSSYQTDSASFDNRINNSQPIGYLTTASYNLDSASFNIRIENATNEQYLAGFATTQSLNDLSTSVDSRLDLLESFSSSADSRYVLSGSITQTTWDNISGKPNNLISSSAQITEYGFISESVDISSLNSFTQSAEQRLGNLEAATSSYLTSLDGAISNSAQVDYNYISNTPNNIISSSNQISELGYAVTSSNVFDGNQTISASLYVSGTTELGGNLIPATPRGATLGTSERPFADIFIQSASIHIQSDISGTIDTTLSNVSGNIQISAGGMQLLGSGSFNAASASVNYISGNVYFDILQNTLQNLSSSLDSRIIAATNEQNLSGFATTSSLEVVSASAWGAFTSASSYSSSLAAAISASDAEYTSFSASLQSTITTLSTSVDSRLDTLESFSSSQYKTDSASFDTRINSITLSSGSNLTYLLEAYASVTYTLPGGFTEDPCRYSYVSVNENVPSNWFNTSSYRFTPQKAGYWEINAAYDVYRNTEASMAIRKNGSIVASAGSFNAIAQEVSKIIYLNGSTDYIDIVNTGGASNSRSQYQQRSWFQAKFVGNISGSTDLPSGLISGSSQLTSSFDGRYVLSGSITQTTWDNIENKPAGIISSSGQISGLGFATTSSLEVVSASAWGAYTSASAYSASAAATYAIKGGDATFNSVTANQYIVSSSVYYVTQSYSSGSTIFGNTSDDTHQFTGSVSISGSLTASLQLGYMWVGDGGNIVTAIPTASFVSASTFNELSASYNTFSSSAHTNYISISSSIGLLQTSLGATSVPFSASSVVNPSSYVLVTYSTASYNGGTMDLIAVDTVNNRATSTNYQFVNAGSGTGIAQNGKASSGAGAPNPSLHADIVSGSVRLKVSDTGTFTFKGVIRLF